MGRSCSPPRHLHEGEEVGMTEATQGTTSAFTQPCLPGFEPDDTPSDEPSQEDRVIRVLMASARAKLAASKEADRC